MVLDWGVHMLDQIMMMIQKPLRSVYAIMSHVTNDDVDDGFKIFLDFEGGLNVQVEVGTSNFVNLPRWYMQGNNGTAVMPDWFAENGKIVMVSDWENRDAVPVVTAAGLTKTMAPPDGRHHSGIPYAHSSRRRQRLLPQRGESYPGRGAPDRHPRSGHEGHESHGSGVSFS